MLQEWQTGKVIDIVDETHNTKRFFIEAKEIFDFKPGQFVTLDLPIHEKKNKRWRSYSIASSPNNTPVFELVIVLVDDGLGTNYIFKEIKIGDEILFRGPAGVFVLPEKIEDDYYFICTGTGIAPFRSMAHYLFNNKIVCKNIYLIYGTRTQKDLLYFEELNELQNKFSNFHYFPTLSREDWNGKKGYVHDVYKELLNGNSHAHFMLCGWKNMIDEAKQTLATLGFEKSQIHSELYG